MWNEKLWWGGEIQKKTPNTWPGLPDNHPNVIKAKDKKNKGWIEARINTKEEIEMEKLFHELEVAAKKLQEELSFNWDVNFENQKNRQEIKIEKTKNGFIVNSWWQKTEIIAERIWEKNRIISLSIKWKAWELITLWNMWNLQVDDEIVNFKPYWEDDIIVLLGIANIVNSGLFYAKNTENKNTEPFLYEYTLYKGRGKFITYKTSEPWKPTIRTNFLSRITFDDFLMKHIDWYYVKRAKLPEYDIMKRLLQYLNLRFMDEVVNKDDNKDV